MIKMSNISNEYNMVKILQDIGKNFFPNDLSKQRVGMFGFTVEAMARLYGSVILDANMRANEYHTITAKKIDTLLYDASILGIDIETTNPSELVAYIAFNIDSIHRDEFANIENGESAENDYFVDPETKKVYKNYYFIIERDTNINIAGYNFMLEWDVLVNAIYNGKEYVYSARYLTEGDVDPHHNDICYDNSYNDRKRRYIKEKTLSVLNDKYIQGNVVKNDSGDIFMMRVNLRQMEKKYEYYTVTENDFISLTGIEFPYDDYLSHFNVYYRSNQSSNWEYINPISVYDTSKYTEKTVQYQIDRDSKILILNFTEFDVKYNAEFRIDMFTTKGSSGNITYDGDGSDILCEMKSYDGNHIYNGIDLICMPITSAKFGRDTSLIDDVRAKVIRAKASRNALSTEYDLYNFMKERDLINDYFFIKKRSDILEHIYSTFTILRDANNNIIPTTTVNLLVKKEDDIKNGISLTNENGIEILSIKTGTAFKNVLNLVKTTSVDISETQSTNAQDFLNKYSNYIYNNSIDSISINDESIIDSIISDYENLPEEEKNKLSKEKNILDSFKESILKNKDLLEIAHNEFSMESELDKFLITPYDRLNSDDSILSNSELVKKESIMKMYGLPYTLVYDSVNQLSSLYLTSISRNVDMSTVVINDSLEMESNFIIDHISIKRNSSIGDDFYKIDVSVMANGDYSNCVSGEYINTGITENALMLKGFIYNKDESDMTVEDGREYPFAFFDFEFISFSDGVFNFSTNLKINDSLIITDDNIKIKSPYFMYRLSNLIKANDKITSETTHLANVVPNEYVPVDVFNMKIGLAVYYLASPVIERTGVPSISVIEDDVEDSLIPIYNDDKYPEFVNNESETSTIPYIMTNLYINSSDLINLYTDMSYVVRATTDISDDGQYIYFRDIPLLQYSKSIDTIISERISNTISETKVYLDEINSRLDNSFSLDYKFFRTYGPCQYFKLEKSDSVNRKILDNLDIKIVLNARVKSKVTATDSEISSSIKSFLKTYIEKLNDEDDDYTIYMSNITTELETNFSDILKSIDLVDLNGEGDIYRVLLYDKPNLDQYNAQIDGRSIIKNYVPEYINIPIENIIINIIR